ncbi:MAG: hypothetical protein ABR598_07670, partial [Candidatus Dormibacteria bacterium]
MMRLRKRLAALPVPRDPAVVLVVVISVASLLGGQIRIAADEATIAQLQQQFVLPGITSNKGAINGNRRLLAEQESRIAALEREVSALRASPGPAPTATVAPTSAPTGPPRGRVAPGTATSTPQPSSPTAQP